MKEIVWVKWVDSSGSSHIWTDHADVPACIKKDCELIDSIGILIHQDKKKVLLAMGWSDMQVLRLFQIPRPCVRSIETIAQLPLGETD